jgi:seryl-tRNA(Sec) selenium transferase
MEIGPHGDAEAACHWQGWPGALIVAVAALITGSDRAAIADLPRIRGRPRHLVIQRGHVVGIGGGSLLQLLRLTGARPVEVGAADACRTEELAVALAGSALGGLCVAARSIAAGLIGIAPFAWACREAGVPSLALFLDPTDPAPALDAGIDLVVMDEGPHGVIAGRAAMIEACRLQAHGVGRAFLPHPA